VDELPGDTSDKEEDADEDQNGLSPAALRARLEREVPLNELRVFAFISDFDGVVIVLGRTSLFSPVFTAFLVCFLVCHGLTLFKIRLCHPKTRLHLAGGAKDLEKTRNLFVAWTSRVRHLGTRVEIYFDTELTQYPNSVTTFDISRLGLT